MKFFFHAYFFRITSSGGSTSLVVTRIIMLFCMQEHGEQIFNERAAVVDEIPHRLIELLQQQVYIAYQRLFS